MLEAPLALDQYVHTISSNLGNHQVTPYVVYYPPGGKPPYPPLGGKPVVGSYPTPGGQYFTGTYG